MEKQEFVGKIIKEVYINDDATTVAFLFDNKDLIAFDVEGDCCSRSYLEDIFNKYQLLGSLITSIEEIDIGQKSSGDYTEIKYHAVKIHTENGICQFEFRNESNGYYDGYLDSEGRPLTSLDGFKVWEEK